MALSLLTFRQSVDRGLDWWQHFLLTLGYAGWEAGQLEEEMEENSWLAIPADPELLFNTPVSERWQKATEKLGFDVWKLAPDVGHA